MIVVKDIAFVRYQATDLDQMETFMKDFGLYRIERSAKALYLRSSGPIHHCHITELGDTNATLGFGLLAQSEADLQTLANEVGSTVEDNPEPGGGKRVRFRDPSGFLVDVIHGQATLAELPHREPLQMNPAAGRQRFGQAIRLKPQPSTVMRLGHVALMVADFPKALDFYTRVLGFRPSDTYHAGHPDNKIAAFMQHLIGQAGPV